MVVTEEINNDYLNERSWFSHSRSPSKNAYLFIYLFNVLDEI